MKKRMILIAAAALLLTACRGQDSAPHSAETGAGNQSMAVELQTASDHGSTGDSSSEETQTDASVLTEQDVIVQLDWNKKPWSLDEVQALLDQNSFTYQGTWTVSMERADLLLDNGTKLLFLRTKDDTGNEKGVELMMINDQFNDNGFQEDYLNQYDVTADEEYYPETATRMLKKEELWRYNQTDLSIARNEIFARHGRTFDNAFLNAVFRRKSWYQPSYDSKSFASIQDQVLNDFEKKNLSLLIQMEQEREFRKKGNVDYEQPLPVVSGSWIDLDQDGEKERITYTVKENAPYSDQIYELSVGDFQIKEGGDTLHQIPYIASLDGTSTQILVCQDGPSDDPMADVYVYRDKKLKKAGIIPGDDIQIYKDYIYCTAQRDFFQTYQGQIKFRFQDGTVTAVPEEFYEQNKDAVASETIPLYSEKNIPDISVTLAPGDKVTILGSDYKEWVLIQKKGTGEKGWLRCGDEDSPYLCTLPDGRQDDSWNLFEGLSFYG